MLHRRIFLRLAFCFTLPLAVACAVEVTAEESKAPKPQYEHGDIRIPAASAAEAKRESLSLDAAQQYLEDASAAWSGKHQCISCHTNGTYMTVRPALSQSLGAPDDVERKFFLRQLKTLAAENPKKLQRGTGPAQVIYLAAGLAEWDAHVTGSLSAETDQALRLMFSLQREHGSWGTEDCWPPYESDAYHLATVAAMAAGTAPGWLANLDEEEDAGLAGKLQQLKSYLRSEATHDYGRTLLLWSNARMPELMEPEEKQKLIEMLFAHQRDDGGWSLRTMAAPDAWGSGNRAEKLRAEPNFQNPASDGHMTGLAIVALREAGVAGDDPRIKRGLGWLESNQRTSGRWWTRSLNTDRAHYITYSGTALPVLALQMCGALPSK
ncbi:MAG: hypothetical protein P8K78_01770 [Pirellulales bacterium]|nr:hypothetical protein [Pirellulales bacterium]